MYGLVRGGVDPGDTSKQKFVGALGHTSDDESGLVYMRALYMDPASGRFVSEYPEHDVKNWLTYVADNPVNAIDPSGKM